MPATVIVLQAEGRTLDYLAGLAIHGQPSETKRGYRFADHGLVLKRGQGMSITTEFSPSEDLYQGWAILNEQPINFHHETPERVIATLCDRQGQPRHVTGSGPNHLIAGLRAVILDRLGHEAEVPSDILNADETDTKDAL